MRKEKNIQANANIVVLQRYVRDNNKIGLLRPPARDVNAINFYVSHQKALERILNEGVDLVISDYQFSLFEPEHLNDESYLLRQHSDISFFASSIRQKKDSVLILGWSYHIPTAGIEKLIDNYDGWIFSDSEGGLKSLLASPNLGQVLHQRDYEAFAREFPKAPVNRNYFFREK